ncbi:hypothetical protein EXIGLDRAFT_725302 [Exidia glandulosa HHB12029]|uniref:Uncharacterized protein n=1 Tax=Exidia glandulosa HHB12029 TaxID=1314781 RepID=A0A165MJA9_EXIGL|nr:hypothetical protein EXIGLDRAFT_725302 [Exidia glandulosa HHB12029]
MNGRRRSLYGSDTSKDALTRLWGIRSCVTSDEVARSFSGSFWNQQYQYLVTTSTLWI